jgi:hypothetical protein
VVTFAKGSYSAGLWTRHVARAKKEQRQSSTTAGKVTWVQDPVDLRGVPAIGRGVAGAVRGTQPERALIAKQPR